MKKNLSLILIILGFGLAAQAQTVTTNEITCLHKPSNMKIEISSELPMDTHSLRVSNDSGTHWNLQDRIYSASWDGVITENGKIELRNKHNGIIAGIKYLVPVNKAVVQEINEGDNVSVVKTQKFRGDYAVEDIAQLEVTCDYKQTTLNLRDGE